MSKIIFRFRYIANKTLSSSITFLPGDNFQYMVDKFSHAKTFRPGPKLVLSLLNVTFYENIVEYFVYMHMYLRKYMYSYTDHFI